ncbi:MAG TPA: SIMPL domain-containing protein [Anaeromyxobacter sp.]|nr:SIMPL domain-containing protein [Anaeromyxobacter sp.]
MTLAALALAAALATGQVPAPPTAPLPPAAPRTVQVTGEGRAFAAPDVARVTIGVQARDAASVGRASADATARMKRVLAALEKGGVASKDVRTVRYDVEVQRSFERSNRGAVTGYLVSNQVAVTVRDLARLGALLDQVVTAGSDAIEGLSFEKEDTSAERARALEAAVADARAKAAALAKAAGAALGDVLRVVESAPGPIPLRQERLAVAQAGAVPVATGQLEIVAFVDVTVAIR